MIVAAIAVITITLTELPVSGEVICDDDGRACVMSFVDAADVVIRRQYFLTLIESKNEELVTARRRTEQARAAFAEVFAGKCTAKLEVIEPSKGYGTPQ